MLIEIPNVDTGLHGLFSVYHLLIISRLFMKKMSNFHVYKYKYAHFIFQLIVAGVLLICSNPEIAYFTPLHFSMHSSNV